MKKIYVVTSDSFVRNEFLSEIEIATDDLQFAKDYIGSEMKDIQLAIDNDTFDFKCEDILENPTLNYQYIIEANNGEYFGWNIEEIEYYDGLTKK